MAEAIVSVLLKQYCALLGFSDILTCNNPIIKNAEMVFIQYLTIEDTNSFRISYEQDILVVGYEHRDRRMY